MYNFSIPNVSKQNCFHAIRLLCCLIVIYEHSVGLSASSLPTLRLASIAVAVFFMLSGYWVTISLLRSESIKEYAIKRCKKILPPYFIVVIFSAIVLCIFSNISVKEYFINSGFWKYLVANLSTLNFLYPTLPGVFNGLPWNGAVNGALWTIKIEVAFYIFLPVFISFINKHKSLKMVSIIVIYLFSVSYNFLCHFLITIKQFFLSFENQFPAFLTYFVCGISFALFWDKLITKLNYAIIPAFLLLVNCLYFNNLILNILFLPISLAFVVFWFAIKVPVFGNLVTKDFSFGMYLVHYPIVMLFLQQGFFNSCWGLAFAGLLGLSFLLSYLLVRVSE